MTTIDYDPRKVESSYHHSWSIIPQQTQKKTLETQTGYGVRLVNSNEDYSEVPKTNYSEQMPNFSNDYFG